MKLLVICLLVALCLHCAAQNCSGLIPQTTYTPSPHFLDDLVPTAKDCVLCIYVNLTIFTPTSGVGTWTANSQNDAVACLQQATDWIAHLVPPDFPIQYVPQTPLNAKIKFVLKNFQTVANQLYYDDVTLVPVLQPTLYVDPNAINVFFGACTNTSTPCTSQAPLNGNVVFCKKPAPTLTNISGFGFMLVHEFGHTLGLRHTFDSNYSSIILPAGCCSTVIASDTDREPHQELDQPCGTPNTPNNLMAYNYSCHRYLSPRQMAIMHYHLRTDKRNMLTPASYTYALQSNPAFDYTVTGNEVWTIDRYVKGNIIVESGAELTIGCLAAMSRGGKITVKKKAKLLVSGGVLTNISGQLWNGVQVEGDAAKQQVMGNGGFSTQQGVVWFWPGSIVSNALVGGVPT